jgi:transaldolase
MAMTQEQTSGLLAETARSLALQGYTPPGEKRFGSDPAWAALRSLGTLLWLDTGDLDAAGKLWTDDFSNLTTNNTLVNKEVQKGLFDELIPRAASRLRDVEPGISTDRLVTEIGFVVNCRTALRLVEAFDATVSVELHPGMAHDAELSTEYGRRYYAVCPERFIVKVPLTPAGFLAARRLSDDGIPVNFTLGFSARQNVLAAAFSRPAFVNVFMGRLNSFVKDSGLGDGENVGEKATMATQMALVEGRRERGWTSRLIGASMRSAAQIFDLAGLDVFTMPVAAAEEYHRLYHANPHPLESRIGAEFPVETTEPEGVGRLWDRDERVYAAAEALSREDTSGWTGSDFAAAVRHHGCPDLLRPWSPAELDDIRADGKIPNWDRWKDDLLAGRAALDDLMTQAALQSFVTDQSELDARIRSLL